MRICVNSARWMVRGVCPKFGRLRVVRKVMIDAIGARAFAWAPTQMGRCLPNFRLRLPACVDLDSARFCGFCPPGTHGVSGLHEHGRKPGGFRQGVPVCNSGLPELRRPTELVGPFCGQATRRRQAGGRSSRRRHKWALPRCFTLSPIAALPSFKLGPFGDLKARGMHSGQIVQPGLWRPFPELGLGAASIEPH